jgi:hypothetical protein
MINLKVTLILKALNKNMNPSYNIIHNLLYFYFIELTIIKGREILLIYQISPKKKKKSNI